MQNVGAKGEVVDMPRQSSARPVGQGGRNSTHKSMQSHDSFNMTLACSHVHGRGSHCIMNCRIAAQCYQLLYHIHLQR